MARLASPQLAMLLLAGCGAGGADANNMAAPSRPANQTATAQDQAAAAPAEVNLDTGLRFVDAAQCRPGPELRRVLDSMLVHDEATDTWRVGGAVTLTGIDRPIMPRLEVTRSTQDGLRMIDYRSSLDLPAGARWHGLRVRRLVVTHLDVFESDDQDQTDIAFAETPATVRRVLGEHGFDVPLAPAYRELDDGACGGAMQIVAIPGGAALQCGYGC